MNYAQLPATNKPGLVLTSVGDGSGAGKWGALVSEFYDNKVWMVYLPVVANYGPFVYKVDPNTTVSIVGAAYVTDTSTATVTFQQNTADIAALTNLAVTSSAGFTSASGAVSDGDTFNMNVTVVGTPNIVSGTLVLLVEHS